MIDIYVDTGGPRLALRRIPCIPATPMRGPPDHNTKVNTHPERSGQVAAIVGPTRNPVVSTRKIHIIVSTLPKSVRLPEVVSLFRRIVGNTSKHSATQCLEMHWKPFQKR